MNDTSKYGIRLPAPKLGLSKHFQSEEAIKEYLDNHHHVAALKRYFCGPASTEIGGWVYPHNIKVSWKHDLIELSRYWRIERSRADHLEEMLESLEREVADLRGKNGWFRRIFPRRVKNETKKKLEA